MAGSATGTFEWDTAFVVGTAGLSGGGSGTYGWMSAIGAPPPPWAAGVFGWKATAVGLRNPTGSDTGGYSFASAIAAPPAPWAAGTFKWVSAGVGLRKPVGADVGMWRLAGHAIGVTTYIPGPPTPQNPPPTVDVGVMLIEISMALNDLGARTAQPDARIAPAVALLSQINTEWASNPTKASYDANTLAGQLRTLLATSFPDDQGLAGAIDCAEQLAGTWSGDDYV
jgi:hypothetical protein